VFLLAGAVGCATDDVGETDPVGCEGKCDQADGETDAARGGTCVAVRGNGPRIFAHFGALARLSEDIGTIDAVVGGSSGSITAFLSESISMSPGMDNCAGKTCDDADVAIRTAFLFKSLRLYVDRLAMTDEAIALQAIASAMGDIQTAGLEDLVDADGQLRVPLQDATDALTTLFESQHVRELINPELVELVAGPLDPADPEAVARRSFHVADIAATLRSFGAFSVDGPEMFVRPGLFDFGTVAEHIGTIGSFYAGYGLDEGARTELASVLDDCAEAGRGLIWSEVAALSTPSGSCGDRIGALVDAHHKTFSKGGTKSRIDDVVGAHARIVVTTSVLEGQALETFEQARATYLAGSHGYDWDIDFEDVGFGYIGQPSMTGPIVANPLGFDDLKTAKARDLGPMTWRRALTFSPAEPGLARALEIDDNRISAGGWSDLFPVQALRNAGCDTVVFVTGRGGEHPFQNGVARELGMTEANQAALYDVAQPSSALTEALAEADAVWCTDWDGPGVSQVDAIIKDAYSAPLEVRSADDPRFAGYANAVASANAPGCSPGVK